MACANRTLALMREYADLRAEVSQDTTMTGELCSLIATHCLLGHADGENYVRELIETAKRAARPGNDAAASAFSSTYLPQPGRIP